MSQEAILYPVVALAALTFGIGVWLGLLRFRAVKNGDINPAYYKLNRGAKVPEYLAKVHNNYINLLEIPILFYVVSILIYVSTATDIVYVVLSWCFVLTRFVHSYIHTTYNNVAHRKTPFLLGTLILIIEWLRYSIDIIL